ncbi:hypothetical protein FGB62_46g01 [Gracilaria domingensis]|nr:hypothetical protein FGB62_46g01 [Gracilaria domingensis]
MPNSTKKNKRKRLTANSNAVKMLRMKLQTGELQRNEKAEKVWRSEPCFQEHRLDRFRSCYNRVKKNLGLPLKGSTPNILAQSNVDDHRKHDRQSNLTASDVIEVEDSGSQVSNSVDLNKWLLFDAFDLEPFSFISEWKERQTTTRRISVAVLMPSGLRRREVFVRVLENQFLEIKVHAPRAMIFVEVLHEKWLGSTAVKYTD